MKTMHMALYGLAAVLGAGVLYRVATGKNPVYYLTSHPDDADPATRNPWRGSGNACEQQFDALKTDDKKSLLALMKTGNTASIPGFSACTLPTPTLALPGSTPGTKA